MCQSLSSANLTCRIQCILTLLWHSSSFDSCEARQLHSCLANGSSQNCFRQPENLSIFVKSKTYTLHGLPPSDMSSLRSFVAESPPIISCIASSRGPVLNFAPNVTLCPVRESRLRMVKAFPESRMYASIAWSSGIRRRPSSIAMSLFQNQRLSLPQV